MLWSLVKHYVSSEKNCVKTSCIDGSGIKRVEKSKFGILSSQKENIILFNIHKKIEEKCTEVLLET